MRVGASRPLSDLAPHVLVRVADPLALVGLGRALLADPGGDLSNELLVDPPYHHLGGLRDLELDPLRRRDPDRVGVADQKLELLSLQARPVPDALDLQALLEPSGDALDHVGDQAPRQAM